MNLKSLQPIAPTFKTRHYLDDRLQVVYDCVAELRQRPSLRGVTFPMLGKAYTWLDNDGQHLVNTLYS